MKRCVACKNEDLRSQTIRESLNFGEAVFVHLAMPALVCQGCGESYVSGANFKDLGLRVALELGRRGVATASAFRFTRKSLGFTGKDVAVALGTCPETVSRWENKKATIPLSMFVALTGLVRDKLSGCTDTRDQLEALQKNVALEGEIKIAFPVQID